MKYRDGRLYSRKRGHPRNPNHYMMQERFGLNTHEIRGCRVRFIGTPKQAEIYNLTCNKIYHAITGNWSRSDKWNKEFERSEEAGDTITILNDEVKKRKYYHNLFELVNKSEENKNE